MLIDILGSLGCEFLKMLILIVDKSIQIIERLEEIVSEAPYSSAAHKAVSYEEAKKLVEENMYDTVLLDMDLLENGSLRLLREIKKKCKNLCNHSIHSNR